MLLCHTDFSVQLNDCIHNSGKSPSSAYIDLIRSVQLRFYDTIAITLETTPGCDQPE